MSAIAIFHQLSPGGTSRSSCGSPETHTSDHSTEMRSPVTLPATSKRKLSEGSKNSKVSILGQGFTGTTAVSFNGVNAITFSIKSDTYLTATVPSGAKTGTVTVTRPGSSLASIQQFKVTPTISSISPTSGPIGIVVTLNGTGLTQTTKVSFGGVNATTFTVNSDSKVTATVPAGAKTGKITVTTAGGSATSSSTFNVTPTVSSFSPPSGKVGTVVICYRHGTDPNHGSQFRRRGGDHLHRQLRYPGNRNRAERSDNRKDCHHQYRGNCHQFRNLHSYTVTIRFKKQCLGGRECPSVCFGRVVALVTNMFAGCCDCELFVKPQVSESLC